MGNKSYEVTVKIIVDAASEFVAEEIINKAMREATKNHNLVAFINDDMCCIGERV